MTTAVQGRRAVEGELGQISDASASRYDDGGTVRESDAAPLELDGDHRRTFRPDGQLLAFAGPQRPPEEAFAPPDEAIVCRYRDAPESVPRSLLGPFTITVLDPKAAQALLAVEVNRQ